MRKIESPEDQMRGQVTYEIGPKRWITLDVRTVQKHGLQAVMSYYGVEMPTGRLPVFQHGRKVGTVPAGFEPMFIKSTTFLYDPRPGDFVRNDEGWVAARTLGPGDLEAVPDFVWERGL